MVKTRNFIAKLPGFSLFMKELVIKRKTIGLWIFAFIIQKTGLSPVIVQNLEKHNVITKFFEYISNCNEEKVLKEVLIVLHKYIGLLPLKTYESFIPKIEEFASNPESPFSQKAKSVLDQINAIFDNA